MNRNRFTTPASRDDRKRERMSDVTTILTLKLSVLSWASYLSRWLCMRVSGPQHEERPCKVAMPPHSDLFITFECVNEQHLGAFAIVGRAAIYEHHRLETAYLCLFKKMRYSLGL